MKQPALKFQAIVEKMREDKLKKSMNTYNSGYIQALNDLEEHIEILIFDERDHLESACELGQEDDGSSVEYLIDTRYGKL
jgi:hypothetical protein